MADRQYLRSRGPRHNRVKATTGYRWALPKQRQRTDARRVYNAHPRPCLARFCDMGGCVMHPCSCEKEN